VDVDVHELLKYSGFLPLKCAESIYQDILTLGVEDLEVSLDFSEWYHDFAVEKVTWKLLSFMWMIMDYSNKVVSYHFYVQNILIKVWKLFKMDFHFWVSEVLQD